MTTRQAARRVGRATLAFVVAAAFVASSAATAASAPGRGDAVLRPDEQIRVGATGEYQGDDVYAMDDPAQTAYGGARLGHTIVYFVLIENDAVVPDQFRLRGRGSTTAFSVHYRSGGTGITRAVVDGAYTTPVLEPGASVTVKVIVGIGHAQPGQTFNATLAARSVSDPDARDRVRFVTIRRCGDLGCH